MIDKNITGPGKLDPKDWARVAISVGQESLMAVACVARTHSSGTRKSGGLTMAQVDPKGPCALANNHCWVRVGQHCKASCTIYEENEHQVLEEE